MIHLMDIYEQPERLRVRLLWTLLANRDETINISHKAMPTWVEHVAFVASQPYAAWYAIMNEDAPVGAIYLSKQDEIGIFILRDHQGNGYGKEAVKLLMAKHGERRYLANINPHNERSIKFFTELGFKQCQLTMELTRPTKADHHDDKLS